MSTKPEETYRLAGGITVTDADLEADAQLLKQMRSASKRANATEHGRFSRSARRSQASTLVSVPCVSS